ncbi:PIR protein [Plasmodium vivax]|uniref:VIR protein n=1 Tax=Plasmodium vivax TaxID=5855 RepID=A0A564ZV49_PLAVI|nr:PIR protein [Plasmodium vivax]
MASGYGSTIFSELYRKSSKELYSERFYEAMDMDSQDLQKYDSKCNDIRVTKSKDQMIPICKKYLRFLATSKEWSGIFSGFDVSLLLNYWLYEKLNDIYGPDYNELIRFGFSALQLIWAYFDDSRIREQYYNNCKPLFEIVNHQEWKNRKKLFEYYVNYDTLFRMAQGFSAKCKEYVEYFKEMISVYKDFEGKCSPEKHNCPNFFYEFKNKNPVDKLEILSCYTQIDQKRTAAAKDRLSMRGDSLHSTVPKVGVPSHGVDGALPHSAGSSRDTQSTSQSSDIGTEVSHSVLGAAPVLLTATMLYRHTPLGPWIRRLRGGRTNSINTIDTFSHYTPETGEMFSDDPANYISYQPM